MPFDWLNTQTVSVCDVRTENVIMQMQARGDFRKYCSNVDRFHSMVEFLPSFNLEIEISIFNKCYVVHHVL